mmetsp:Transcript_15542/g.52089  ORF Transcript_15542/g.52089 Transcript_15542/m.52089 type:complete len:110 (+) Transcript_15542:310-639(+)
MTREHLLEAMRCMTEERSKREEQIQSMARRLEEETSLRCSLQREQVQWQMQRNSISGALVGLVEELTGTIAELATQIEEGESFRSRYARVLEGIESVRLLARGETQELF